MKYPKAKGEARAGIKSLSLWTFWSDFLPLKGLTIYYYTLKIGRTLDYQVDDFPLVIQSAYQGPSPIIVPVLERIVSFHFSNLCST